MKKSRYEHIVGLSKPALTKFLDNYVMHEQVWDKKFSETFCENKCQEKWVDGFSYCEMNNYECPYPAPLDWWLNEEVEEGEFYEENGLV